MEEGIIIEQEQEQESNEDQKSIDIYEKENSSQETSHCIENEIKSPNKECFSQNVFKEDQTPQETEEKDVEIKNKNSENISTYILKYTRTKEELKEVTDTNMKKSKKCSFMLNIKLVPIEDTEKEETPNENKEYYLVISCHEIAAFYFDEIYERVYKLEDLNKENKFFRIFATTEEIKAVIDEFIIKNQKNKNKFFIDFKDKKLKIHMKLSFFDKEQEIIFNIQKKQLSVREKAKLLPEFLKEIQNKMIYLCEENKIYKNNEDLHSPRMKELKYNLTYNNNFVNKSIEITKEENKNNKKNIELLNNSKCNKKSKNISNNNKKK
jgi:hypothetical protein